MSLHLSVFREISIHALREESDSRLVELGAEYKVISIHALREESDQSL